MKNCAAMLNPGGRLAITAPNCEKLLSANIRSSTVRTRAIAESW